MSKSLDIYKEEKEREFGISQISLVLFRLKGECSFESIRKFINSNNVRHSMRRHKEGFIGQPQIEADKILAIFGKEGVRTLKFLDRDTYSLNLNSLRVVPDNSQLQFRKKDGFIQIYVYGGNENFIKRNIARTIRRLADTYQLRLTETEISQEFIRKLGLHIHRNNVEYIKLDPTQSKDYAILKRVKEELEKEAKFKVEALVEEGTFKGHRILNTRALQNLFDEDPNLRIVQFTSKVTLITGSRFHQIKYSVDSSGRVRFFVNKGVVDYFEDEFEAAEALINQLEEDANEQMLLTDAFPKSDTGQLSLFDAYSASDLFNSLLMHANKNEFSAVSALLNKLRGKKDELSETELNQLIDMLINTIRKDTYAAFDMLNRILPVIDDNKVLPSRKEDIKKILKQMDAKTFYRFSQVILDSNVPYLIQIIKEINSEDYLNVQKVRKSWQECVSEKDFRIKGKRLEEFCNLLFCMDEGLIVKEQDCKLSDEEIDLYIQNNVSEPFWSQLNSPFIFVECKNWTSKIEAKHIRDFRQKLDDHSNICKLGFFIAVNGFTKGIKDQLIKSGKEGYILCPIEGKDIERFLEEGSRLREFLENLISRVIQ